jgi:hypothetical protein
MNVNTTLLAFFAMSGAAFAIPNPLKPPADLSIDFRSSVWQGLASATSDYTMPSLGVSVADDVSFDNEDPAPEFTWSPKLGLGTLKYSWITNPNDIPPGPTWPKPIRVEPKEELVINWSAAITAKLLGNVTGVWLDGMKPGTTVEWGTNYTIFAGYFGSGGPEGEAVANQYGDAFISFPTGTESVALDAPSDSYHIAGFSDPPLAAHVPDSGNTWVLLAVGVGVLLVAAKIQSRQGTVCS